MSLTAPASNELPRVGGQAFPAAEQGSTALPPQGPAASPRAAASGVSTSLAGQTAASLRQARGAQPSNLADKVFAAMARSACSLGNEANEANEGTGVVGERERPRPGAPVKRRQEASEREAGTSEDETLIAANPAPAAGLPADAAASAATHAGPLRSAQAEGSALRSDAPASPAISLAAVKPIRPPPGVRPKPHPGVRKAIGAIGTGLAAAVVVMLLALLVPRSGPPRPSDAPPEDRHKQPEKR